MDSFDLPPKQVAAPLPTTKAQRRDGPKSKPTHKPADSNGKSRTRDLGRKDDTPKAFARLMQLRDTGRGSNGLDNGDADSTSKKRKRAQSAAVKPAESQPSRPTILPGERLADFAARVNIALPVAGLARKAKQVDGVKERQTKHEKKLQKLVKGWKDEEVRRQDKFAEERELAEEDIEEENLLWEDRRVELARGKKAKRQEKDDDWEQLRSKRDEPKGLHDVAQAPPQFDRVPKEIFKAKGKAENVPSAAGSLRRREELGETRLGMIEAYRKMMAEKRAV